MPRFVFAIVICVVLWFFTWRGLHGLTFFPWWLFLVFALYNTWRLLRAIMVGFRLGKEAMLKDI